MRRPNELPRAVRTLTSGPSPRRGKGKSPARVLNLAHFSSPARGPVRRPAGGGRTAGAAPAGRPIFPLLSARRRPPGQSYQEVTSMLSLVSALALTGTALFWPRPEEPRTAYLFRMQAKDGR